MDDVADLVLTPFRDIVEKGKQAVENAGDAQPMLKTSQNLVKEGERALKRIEPLCRKHLEEYGSNFLDALKENDDIANFRSELTDLLWEFDDFIELDDFEPEKFAELQALSRKAAPKIYDILMRMKLEVPPDNDARSIVMMRMSRPSSPPPVPLPPLPPNAASVVQSPVVQSPVVQSPVVLPSVVPPLPERKSSKSPPTVEEATAQLRRMMQSQSGPDEGFQLPPLPGPPPKELPPRPPSANPWDVKTPPVPVDRRMRDDFSFQRRAPVASPELPPVEAVSPVSPEKRRHDSTGRPRPLKTTHDRSSHQSDERSLSPGGLETASYERGYSVFPGTSPRSRTPNSNSFMSTSIPEDYALNRSNGSKYGQPAPRYSQINAISPQLSRPESLESDPSSVFDHRRTDRDSTSAASEHRSSDVSAAPTSPTLGTSELSPTSPLASVPHHPGLETVHRRPVPEIDYGPIPVESERQAHNPNLALSTIESSINANSSFYIHKGFCEGAQEVIRGEAGVRKTKRPGFAGPTSIAKCAHCFYELDFKEIELDVYKDDRGNFIKHGIGFRVRFLQKCHVATKRVDDVLYGCVFCIHQGRTLNASDATVFISQKALFQHLARHPRPLAKIPGITVVDAPEVPPELKNNYDIHFKNPPELHPLVDKAEELALLPTASSKEAARRMYGQRLLFDRTPALEMVQGAKITGITWPDKYLGEWAFGWHDGTYASVPTEIIRLDQPPDKHIKMSGSSQIRAVARWKFNPKDKDKYKGDWLKFDKGEVITNIGFPYREYWCWTGTNAKGKWGLFPQAFIDETTVEDMTAGIASDRASVLSSEKNRSMSMLTRLSTRKSARNGRPPSIAGSVGSHETPPPYLSFMRN